MIHGIQNGVGAFLAQRMPHLHLLVDEIEEKRAHLHLLRQVMVLGTLGRILADGGTAGGETGGENLEVEREGKDKKKKRKRKKLRIKKKKKQKGTKKGKSYSEKRKLKKNKLKL